MSYIETWDETKPAGSRDANLGDDDIREYKRAIRERLAGGGMYFPSTDDADAGKYNWVNYREQSGNPTSAANEGFTFCKDVAGVTELFWMDSAGTVAQLTSGGGINAAVLKIASQAAGDILYFNGTNWVRLPKGTALQLLRMNSGATAPEWASLALRGYLSGCVVTNDNSDPTNDLGISAGVAVDDTHAYSIALSSAFVKRGDAAFSAGTGNGGGDITGSAGKRYIYLIGKSTDASAADVFFSSSAPGAVSLPATWDIKRLIGVRYWDGSKWALFKASGQGAHRKVTLYSGIKVINAATPTESTFTDVDLSAYVDASYVGLVRFNIVMNAPATQGAMRICWRPNGSPESIGSANTIAGDGNAADYVYTAAEFDPCLDSNGIFEYALINTGSVDGHLRGYEETL